MPALTTIPQHYVTEFDKNWQHLTQRKMDAIKEFVTVDTVSGKEKSYNQLSSMEMQPVTVRAGDTRLTDASTSKRWLRPYPFDLANLFDQWDEEFLGEIVLPTSAVQQAHTFAYNRAIENLIIASAVGTAYTGETGVTPTVLPTPAQEIAVNYVESGSPANSGFTLAKWRAIKYLFDNADIDEEDPRIIAIGAKQLQDLLRATEITSSDYAAVKALVDGNVNTFLGFQVRRVRSGALPYDSGTDVRKVVAWVKSGITIADSGKQTLMDIRADKSHAIQIRTVAAFGGTRNEEIKVATAACDESP